MNISAKSRYAVSALIELADRATTDPGRPIRLTDIAHGREIPLQFLEQLFATLRRAGVLRSRRGAAGGYSFARSPEAVTVLAVVAVLDGVAKPQPAAEAGAEGEPGVVSIWTEVEAAVADVLGRTTIADLLERERLAQNHSSMYYI